MVWLGIAVSISQQGHQGIRVTQSKNNKGTVVLIEPDVSVRDALTVLLEGENWRVNCLDDCNDLLAALEETQ